MATYTAPLRDMQFVLDELLELEHFADLEGFADAPKDVSTAILEEAGRLAGDVLAPLNAVGDHLGCRLENAQVSTAPGFREAYRLYAEGGWTGLTASPDYGGQGLPHVLGIAVREIMTSANLAFSMVAGLSHGAANAIANGGSAEQKALFLPPMIAGRWTGTMNLTEPHCGTDLGLLRSRAQAQGDGSYRISGTKIFISAGEHDLAENIIHLVLARLPDAPAGVKGISLFIVPKFLVNPDGSLGARNGVQCGSLEEKMGIHGNPTCVMNYDDATGYLLGEAHQGLKVMFVMMNSARLAVGVQGLSLASVAYQNAASYARDRLQGRAPGGAVAPQRAADPIVAHPDVQRMLLTQRAFVEGARALAYWAGLQVDLAHKHPDPQVRESANDLLGLLTPMIKAYCTDQGVQSISLAMQCFGGHGYIREWGIEQFLRDACITPLYEGTNGVQAMDLVARKLRLNEGRAVNRFMALVEDFCQAHHEQLGDCTGPLAQALGDLQQATGHLLERDDPRTSGGAAVDYLHLTALVAFGLQWAKMALIADRHLARSEDGSGFYRAKGLTARFFFERILPQTAIHLQRVRAGAQVLSAFDPEQF
ncbi:acyl-CoA dehydrogenase C-terminal domain-containing protein [Pseudomonas sp. JQ170]|uniref:acyl-CoA dehydrogenase C-terminal domain-containing protein n=1 Tax=unclassified Pseudomonas TaxID=196821 RepID=UPI00264CD600|nr:MULTISPECIES: acyl-CoA dehydrogenase C-terminal domain-containing protein [unclassified Pseudomonas]MDN7139765.1 acyl-CoA dehydrogenase C-terminal domain-containing protein [Pseudomonas sp. JQ170]WRO73780.1 acyl-CoA dehydrogenase C-terminal domain-containing protein [Pseudomonas sp. 170C]